MEVEITQNKSSQVQVYKYRWVILAIFCLYTVINFAQFIQFSIIANIIKSYYKVDEFSVDFLGLIFFVVYILGFLPISYLIERYNLRITSIVSTAFTLAGISLKLLCAQPDRYYVALIGQALVAIGQVYMISIPSKLASVWFGPKEVSTACAIAVLGTQMGVALGCVIPLTVKGDTEKDISNNLFYMMLGNAIFAGVVFILVLIFMKPKPFTPPSLSQVNLIEDETESFFASLKKLIKNKDYIFVLCSLGLSNGLWTSFGILLNTMYLHYFPDGINDAGTIALIAIISGGCIATIVFGYILDKTHQFKKVSFSILMISTATFGGVIYSFVSESKIGTYFAIPIFGFFLASSLVVAFEYALEVTYPIPESVSCSVLNAVIYSFAIICTLVIETSFNSFGHVNTYIGVTVLLFICAVNSCFISSNLRRRDANVSNNNPL